MTNCTFSENMAYSSVAGGIYNGGTVTIENTIFKTGAWGEEGEQTSLITVLLPRTVITSATMMAAAF